ncbi:MAG TPA: CPBP family intramembrane glutamic endopeptidase [Thermoleophilaceae bacterium]|nr:CPBP family intramembrane glutamic endopeptidase [Thermoleophilaceae bacterium]
MTREAPELPEAARPAWPAWNAPVARLSSFVLILASAVPLLPAVLLLGFSETVAALALLVLLLVQDGALVAAALVFANLRLAPRLWHFGIRATRLWPTLGWAALGFAVMLGFELGYIELLGVDETNLDDLGEGSVAAASLVALAVIVVAPLAEEFFFRGFFYRALRTRMGVWAAAPIDGLVFGALHFQGVGTAVILPVIAVFGVGQCLVYERTGSLFAVIAIHAAFNTVAMMAIEPLPAIVVGSLVIAACLAVPRVVGPNPSPLPA